MDARRFRGGAELSPRALLATAALALAVPGAASAAQISAGPSPVTYNNPTIEIAPGESVSFLNLDLGAPHDVTATGVGPGGKALFRSDTVGFGTEVPVVGAEKLVVGSYDFLCSVHTFMKGQINVGGGGGVTGGLQLKLRLDAFDRKLDEVEKAGGLRLRAGLNAAATLVLKVRRASGGAAIATARRELEEGGNRFRAKLTEKGERVIAKAKHLKLEVDGRAADAVGNPARETIGLTLR